jgi:hypothetical protein
MARKPKKTATPKTLLGADEFAGPDAEQEAIEKIAAARDAATEEEADKKNGDNGGPILDENAWRRAANELVAEQIEIDELMESVAEIRGRISSIKKVAEKCGADWDVIKLYAKYAKRVRQGASGEIVTELRRLGALMRLMGSPLHTQFGLFAEEPKGDDGAPARPGMDAELQGQHAYSNNEPRENNPFQPGTQDYVDWGTGWNAAQTATAMKMAPREAAAH